MTSVSNRGADECIVSSGDPAQSSRLQEKGKAQGPSGTLTWGVKLIERLLVCPDSRGRGLPSRERGREKERAFIRAFFPHDLYHLVFQAPARLS